MIFYVLFSKYLRIIFCNLKLLQVNKKGFITFVSLNARAISNTVYNIYHIAIPYAETPMWSNYSTEFLFIT